VKFCPDHLKIVIADHIQRKRKLNAEIVQRQTLQEQQKPKNFRIKPLFEKDKRYFNMKIPVEN
jgi:hypothetical protein